MHRKYQHDKYHQLMLSKIREKIQSLPEHVQVNNTDWYKDRKIQQNEFMLREKNREIEDRNQKMFSRLSKIQYVKNLRELTTVE